MINNDILRRLRYALDFSDAKMVAIFAQADAEVTREQLSAWLKKDEDPECVKFNDTVLATFLNGLINELRGKREGPPLKPESHLTNNLILRKLKIALDLKSEDLLEMMDQTSVSISKHELSAFFRKPGHQHYRVCKDQVLRNFIDAMRLKYRDSDQFEKS